MQRGGGQNATERDAAIGGIEVQFVADPGLLPALGVALGADITGLRQIGQHPGQGLVRLLRQPARLLGRALFALARAPALARLLGWLRLRGRSLARRDGGRIARHVADQMVAHGVLDQGLVQAARQGALRELGKGAGEGRLAGQRAATLQPHNRRSGRSWAKRSSSSLVVANWKTALAMKARANAARSLSGRPRRGPQGCRHCSGRTNASTAVKDW